MPQRDHEAESRPGSEPEAAVRIFVLEHTEAAAGEDLIRRVLAIAANAQMRGDTSHSFSIKKWATLVDERPSEINAGVC